jgi:hypothetical protein
MDQQIILANKFSVGDIHESHSGIIHLHVLKRFIERWVSAMKTFWLENLLIMPHLYSIFRSKRYFTFHARSQIFMFILHYQRGKR